MPPNPTSSLDAKLFLECIYKEDWHNPAIVIWIENMLMISISSADLGIVASVSDLVDEAESHTSQLFVLCSILLRYHGRISEAIHRLELALYHSGEPKVTQLLRLYYHEFAGMPGLLQGKPLGFDLFHTAFDLHRAWRTRLDFQRRAGQATSDNSTSTIALDPLSDSGYEASEPEETLEDWAQSLPTRSASQEVADLMDEYKAASDALQAKIWYLDP